MFGLEERALVSPREMKERERLLASRRLSVPGNESVILGFFEEERLVATGSLVGNILQGIAVDRELEGEGVAATVTSALLKKAMQMGRRQLFLYSKPDEAKRFEALGFTLLATATVKRTGLGASLLEWGAEGIDKWRMAIATKAEGGPEGGRRRGGELQPVHTGALSPAGVCRRANTPPVRSCRGGGSFALPLRGALPACQRGSVRTEERRCPSRRTVRHLVGHLPVVFHADRIRRGGTDYGALRGARYRTLRKVMSLRRSA